MLVFDSSAAVYLLLGGGAAAQVEAHVAEHDNDMHTVQLLDIEVISAFRRLVARGETAPWRASAAIDLLGDLPLRRHPLELLVPRVRELRHNFSAYDATYVALAETFVDDGATVLTADRRLARAIEDHTSVPVISLT